MAVVMLVWVLVVSHRLRWNGGVHADIVAVCRACVVIDRLTIIDCLAIHYGRNHADAFLQPRGQTSAIRGF
jgi:hypothetical protein